MLVALSNSFQIHYLHLSPSALCSYVVRYWQRQGMREAGCWGLSSSDTQQGVRPSRGDSAESLAMQ